ncbi:MAG TPA: glycosyltransferase family 8 protein [Terrimicrobiaceae bacterium]
MRHLGIACGGDDNYATGIAVALYSALSNLSTQVTPTVYVMDGGLSSEHRERLEHVITRVRPDSSIVWCRISADELAKLPSYGYLSQSTYLRLFVGQFVQEQTQRIVYIDCDLLVVGDLSVVLDLDFGDCPVGGVRDFIFDDISHLPQPLPEEQCFPWDPKGGYYQAGVCVIDWPRYSALGVEKKALAFGTRLCDDPAVRSDQDVLNPVLAGHWLELPCTYNFCSQLLYIEEFLPKKERHRAFLRERSRLYSEAKVLHFAGQPKPWHHWATDPGATRWVRALRRSGWLDLRSKIRWLIRWIPRRTAVKLKQAFGLLKKRESTASVTDY